MDNYIILNKFDICYIKVDKDDIKLRPINKCDLCTNDRNSPLYSCSENGPLYCKHKI